MNHGQNLKINNLKDQASHDFGSAPFKKTENMLINSNSKERVHRIILICVKVRFFCRRL